MSGPNPVRRAVLRGLALGGCGACVLARLDGAAAWAADPGPKAGSPVPAEDSDLSLHPARWVKKLDGGRVECGLCPRKCRVADLERGACGVRENHGGEYYSLAWGRACSVHLDPIEKKPFYHVLPGGSALSLAAPGCNMECRFCQNWEIAQVRPEQVSTVSLPPGDVVGLARREGAPTIACTYSEPVVWSEYVFDIAVAGRAAGLRTLLVSNGFVQPEPLDDLAGVLGAVKIDLKAMTEKFYREVCGGELKPVLETLRRLRKRGVWTEIVVLVVPTLNDSDAEFRDLARFVARDLGSEVPVHFTRFHPYYRLTNLPRTPVPTLERARAIALAEGLAFVYVGNVPGHPGNHTYCPGCRAVLIERTGMTVTRQRLSGGRCPDCRRAIPGIWS